MSVVANVAINVDSTAAERALKNLGGAADALQRKFDDLPSKLGSGLQGLGGKIQGFGQQLTGLGSVMAGIGASAAVGGFVKAGIEADRTRKTIKALADQYGETEKVTKFATDAANKFGLGQTASSKAVADLYGRLRPMGVSLDNIQKTFIGVNNAAAKMNLTAADTDGVMLQLSQAMGSGRLQGDELRSVMERLPAVGQAVAKVMGVTAGEIKQLGADGLITTDVIIKAMDELAKMQPPPPDAYKLFQKAMADLNTTIGDQLLPVFTPLVQKLGELVAKFEELKVGTTIAQALAPLGQALLGLLDAFLNLDPGIQKIIIQIGVLVGAFALIAAPLGFVIAGIGSLVSAVGGLASSLAGLKILASIAGWLGAVGPAVGAVVGVLKTLGAVVAAVFSGPVGWVALAIAAGVAIYAFRDKIAAAFRAIVDVLKIAAEGWYRVLIEPVIKWMKGLYDNIVTVAKKIAEAFAAPFKAIANFIRGIINSIIGGVERAINGAIGGINNLVRGANRALSALRLPTIPLMGTVNLPRFAEGGMVTRPTVAMIGEGGEPEYVVPQSKAGAFAQNWISGSRGAGALMGSSSPAINITTGPVMQQGGQNYVTIQDMEAGLQSVADTILSNSRSYSSRRFTGVA